MRAVLDVNVLVSALLSRSGTPAQLLLAWLAGELELVASRRLLAELRRALAYDEVRAMVSPAAAGAFVELVREGAIVAPDPRDPPSRSRDPGDDYLLALAESERAFLVTGDRHLLELADRLPILSPRAFLERLRADL